MTYSICLIGNSHIAALKQAWTNRAPTVASGLTPTFFSAQNRLMAQLTREGRSLVTQGGEFAQKLAYTSGGKDRIDVDDYDAFVLVGSGFGVEVPKFLELGGTADFLKWGPVSPLLSRACFEAATEAALNDCLLINVLGMIRAISRTQPILIACAPYLSERVLTEPPLDEDARLRDPEFLAPLVAMCRAAAERVAARHGSEIVWQNEITVAMPGFTKLEYGLNPARFSMKGFKTPEFDARHGNEDYGILMLSAVLERLDKISGGRVLPAAEAA